jgi:hypothetical protein
MASDLPCRFSFVSENEGTPSRRIELRNKLTLFSLLAAGMAWSQCRVIDDFTTGTTQIDLRVTGPGVNTNTQTGSMIGGLRHVNFFTHQNPFLQLGEAKVEKGGPLTVSNGVREFSGSRFSGVLTRVTTLSRWPIRLVVATAFA